MDEAIYIHVNEHSGKEGQEHMLILRKLAQLLPQRYALKSYAQEGEDLILRRIFENKKSGFYIDIGAHHPKRFSNTYLFYRSGWSGINIDAMPGCMRQFRSKRPRDINIEQGIASAEGKLSYFMFQDPALNTFSRALAEQYRKAGWELLKEREVAVAPLSAVLEKHIPKGTPIDFLSIDVEGLEKEVIRSNDWSAYHPQVIVIEALDFDLAGSERHEVYRDLSELHYRLYAKTVNSLFFLSCN